MGIAVSSRRWWVGHRYRPRPPGKLIANPGLAVMSREVVPFGIGEPV